MGLQALSDYTLYSRYARYLKDKKRRETWSEMVDRVFDMHAKKLGKLLDNQELKDAFDFAKKMVLKKRVLGSQRALQFGGEPILKSNSKIYNCSSLYIDKPKAFQDVSFLLLSGCGVGASVEFENINKLPKIQKRTNGKSVYQIPDSIEGWADSIGVLLSSYFEDGGEFPEYKGKIVEFDFSLIRPKGALIAGQFKAPGPIPLKNGLIKIEKLLEKIISEGQDRLKPINAYDVLMHCSDFVLSGGIRRAASIILFSKGDKEMMLAKTGSWFIDNPQRARSNNSVSLLREETTKEEFNEIFKYIREFGEPGVYFSDQKNALTNPCQPAWATLLTKEGVKELKDVNIGDEIWSETGWTKIINKWSTGIKKVFEYKTTFGSFYGTENHKIISNGKKIEADFAKSIDILKGEHPKSINLDPQTIMDGVVFGDGGIHKASNNLICLYIGENDKDYFNSEIKDFITKHRPGITKQAFEIKTKITHEELQHTYFRHVPDRYFYSDKFVSASFLRGLYSANGSVVNGRVTLKASSFKVIKRVQIMLSSLGIRSYYTTNKASNVLFSNGNYKCKQSYDLNITSDRERFYILIGFIQKYKNEKLKNFILNTKSHDKKRSANIVDKVFISEEEVFDITVDNETHTYWTGGVNVSNCCEIGMFPQLPNGETGVSFCNLVEINGKYCVDKESFFEACKAASIIGTIQSLYDSFPYLGKTTEEIVRHERLLGCSITGWMDNPNILFNKNILEQGAEIIKVENEKIAKLIGINPSARITCAKPAGSTSCILSTSSGIHPHHARRYIRRVQGNKTEFPVQHYKKINPIAVENSVWSANNTDEVVSFACEVPPGAVVKNDLDAIQLLEKVKTAQQHWVLPGTVPERGLSPKVTHNVSNTISVKDDEWDKVRDYIYKNRDSFAGVSLLSVSGDLDYAQAPFTTVLNERELATEYGPASILASGLVVDGLQAFNNNLWEACDYALGNRENLELTEEPKEPVKPRRKKGKSEKEYSKELANYGIQLSIYFSDKVKFDEVSDKLDWIRRFKQFATRYFNSDFRKTSYCLKHVYTLKQYVDLVREVKPVDWSSVSEDIENNVEIDTLGAVACSAGKCEI